MTFFAPLFFAVRPADLIISSFDSFEAFVVKPLISGPSNTDRTMPKPLAAG